jgi:pimeloyl-ACP methyl ester carboxylesterase
MGNVGDQSRPSPQAIEWNLPWGAVLRGVRWGDGPDVALLLHERGTDVDAWGPLPANIARQLAIETIAVDLPGHGLSDDPWEPQRLPDLLGNLPEIAPEAGFRFLIAAGDSAIAALDRAPTIELSGLVCLSPQIPGDGWRSPRSPGVPKLLAAGSMAGDDLRDARRLASACGGWAVVRSYPVAERGTLLLASPWGGHLTEEIVSFLRDCQRRPGRAGLPTGRTRPDSVYAPRGRAPSPGSDVPGIRSGEPSGSGGES